MIMQSVNAFPQTVPTPAIWAVRLALGLTVLLGAILFFLGGSWDIQWHTLVGRDRTLIPPHIVMLTGVTLSGVAALAAVVSETVLARRNPLLAQHSTAFATGFKSTMGAYLAGFAALAAAIAFPLDSYWHSLYGIDVAIWAPFHIMFILGMGLVALGAAYMLVSTAHLTQSLNLTGVTRIAYGGTVLALATMLSLLTLLLFDGIGGPLYPLLASFLGGWVLMATKYAVPGRWSALAVVAVSLVLVAIVFLFVPPATAALVQSENLAYLRGGPSTLSVIALRWPFAPFLGAVVMDGIFATARTQQWSGTRLFWFACLGALCCGLWLSPAAPGAVLREILAVGRVRGIISLGLGILGAIAGTKTGQEMGMGMQFVERS
jgi:hypothetical protein